MTARLKLGAQGLSVVLVLAFFVLLVWKVTHQNTSNVATKVDKGHIASGARLHARAARPARRPEPRLVPRQARSS